MKASSLTRIALISLTLVYTSSCALPPPVTLPQNPGTCQKAIKTCINLVQAQDSEITQLKQDRDDLVKKLESQEPPFLPTWVWISGGVLSSLVIGPVGAIAVTVTGSQLLK